MAINRIKNNVGYGLSEALTDLAPNPIVAQRAPTSSDKASIGSTWVDTSTDSVYTLTSVSGTATWVATGGSGGSFATLTVSGLSTLDDTVINGLLDVNGGLITLDTTSSFSIDGATSSNVTVTGAGADLTLSSVGGSVLVESTENAALAIRLHANGGTSETIQIHSDLGTGVGSVNLLSDVGGITLAAGLSSADAINITASAAGGGIDVDSGTAGVIVDTTGAVSLDAAAASNLTVTGAFDVTVSSTGGSAIVSGGEAAIDAVQLTAGNAAGGVRVTSGALAATTGLNLVQGAVNASIQVGAGDPVHAAPKGTLYIKTDAASTTTRLWINTDAGTTWAFTTFSA